MKNNIRCFLNLHDWVYNNYQMEEGTMRQCQRCSREEYLSPPYCLMDGRGIWIQVKEATHERVTDTRGNKETYL